ncbi:hypothetical protein, partial [Sphingorhabdus sp.]|uniref:hypothetical protein n=1 Tax=Sphingorhabdus sp. TaxID=1902408 RepID=UPI0032B85698
VAAGGAGGMTSPVTGWINNSSDIASLQHGKPLLPSYHFFAKGFCNPHVIASKAVKLRTGP